MANDLTFQQLSNQSPADAIQVSDGSTPLNAGVYINVSNLTGDSIQALADAGVVETALKLIQSCRDAQESVNSGLSPGNAFPAVTFGAPSNDGSGNYFANITAAVSARAPLSVDDVVGAQV